MATKRSRPEADDMTDELVHPSRQAHMPHPTKRLRVQEPKLPAYRKQAHTSSVNTVKKKIRDVTRRLGHSDSQTATGRAEDERALAAYQQELEAAEHEKLRQKMIKKYHMVRFFERQKATRLLKKARKQLLSTTDTNAVARLTQELHIADVDLHYTQFSPLNEIYISLYRKDEDDEPVESRKPETWYEVERRMEKGLLELGRLRNGYREELAQNTKRTTKPTEKSQSKKTTAKSFGAKESMPTVAPQVGMFENEEPAVKLNPTPKPAPKPMVKPQSARMTDEAFFRLNRREKRKLLRGDSAPARPNRPSTIVPFSAEDVHGGKDNDSDGGFFEE